jgi:nucleoside-diphosphate-sugar epimerase
MTQVLVFGGNTGVLASRIALRLANAGHQVLFADSQLDTPHPSITRNPIKVMDLVAMSTAVTNVDAIISCIESNPALISGSASALFNALRAGTDKRVVLFSSMAVYGDAEGVITEQSPLMEGDAYANARIKAELLAKESTNTMCLRCGVEYGVGSERWSALIGRLLLSKRLGDLGSAGDGYCNLIHLDDMVTAAIHALNLEGSGSRVFNLSNRNFITWNEYLIRFGLALKAVPLRRIGSRRLKIEKLLGAPLKVIEKVMGPSTVRSLHLPEPITGSMLHAFDQRIVLDSILAEQQLGMIWMDLDEGLRSAAQWVRNA